MLAWALWLANAVIGWLRYGFAAWTQDGYWRATAAQARRRRAAGDAAARRRERARSARDGVAATRRRRCAARSRAAACACARPPARVAVRVARARARRSAARRIRALVDARERGEPIAYLTGRREFWSLDLAVTPDVLIPRPETELLVELALARIPRDVRFASPISARARVRSRSRSHASGRSPACRRPMRARARWKLRAATRRGSAIGNVAFAHGDWCAALGGARFDVIVSNPPYIAADDAHLEAGDLRFEPSSALASGADGLDAIRRIVAERTRISIPAAGCCSSTGSIRPCAYGRCSKRRDTTMSRASATRPATSASRSARSAAEARRAASIWTKSPAGPNVPSARSLGLADPPRDRVRFAVIQLAVAVRERAASDKCSAEDEARSAMLSSRSGCAWRGP